MDDLIAITYIGKGNGYKANFQKKTYEFEWQKGVGIGGRKDEVPPTIALKLSKRKDRRGKRLFYLDKLNREEIN